MKNKLLIQVLFFFIFKIILINPVYSEQFNFDITEVEILEDGNLFKGIKRGTVKTDDGIIIIADLFSYNKITNIVEAEGNVKVEDIVNKYTLFSDKGTYDRNKEIVFAEGNAKGIDSENRTIESKKIIYNKITNIVEAEGNVKVEDIVNKYTLFSDKGTYDRNKEIVFAEGNAKGIDSENRTIESKKIIYNKITNIVEAEGNVKVEDIVNKYTLFSDKGTYDRNKEIVFAEGNVKVEDIVNKYTLFSDKGTYDRNKEIVFAEGNAKGIDSENRTIESKKIIYNKITNIVEAEGNVKVEDKSKNYILKSKKLNFLREIDKIITEGFTEAEIQSRYNIQSKNVTYQLNTKELSSKNKSTIKDSNDQIYYLDEFVFFEETSLLKGKNVLTITNYNLPKSDKFFFLDGMFNLNNRTYVASDTKIDIHKDIFDDENNDPRIYGSSSMGDNNFTTIKKGTFTICQKRDGCPPWSIKSNEIKHDRKKRQIEYKHAVVNVYDFPVFYFPKFFHPDPTVERQSGFLTPEINDSNVLGSSLTQPYFKVISKDKDYTFSPTVFDSDIISLQNEFRQANENSNFIADFGFVNGYKNNNRSHIFAKYNVNLNLSEFDSSQLSFGLEQVSNDTYLKVFNTYISNSEARPQNLNVMNNKIKLVLNHQDYNFTSGFEAYETLDINKNSDRYEYVLPYYTFDTVLKEKIFDGSLSLNSSGNNTLNNTNKLNSSVTNNLNYTSSSYLTKSGFSNNYNFYFKNHNVVGKKSNNKSSPEIELRGLFEANSNFSLIKKDTNYNNYLTPKISFRFNPNGMKNHSSKSRTIDTSNVFSTNRLGIGNSFEDGRSLTLGLDFKKEKLNIKKENEEEMDEINKFFEIKLATVLRDKEENLIPKKSTLHRKTSNIFGSVTNNLYDNIEFNYKFSLDNDLNTFEYNSIGTTFIFDKFSTSFSFLEENGEMGDANVLESALSYNFDENNFLRFKTRRNRKINLTEYYDLVYEYKNDCLTAGVKYKKSYYSDRDLKPTEDLLFTVTLFPLTTYEHDAEDLVN